MTKTETIARDFGCPMNIADAMRRNASVMLVAIKTIGPKRVRWMGCPQKGSSSEAIGESRTSWSLDGRRATDGDLLIAANMQSAA